MQIQTQGKLKCNRTTAWWTRWIKSLTSPNIILRKGIKATIGHLGVLPSLIFIYFECSFSICFWFHLKCDTLTLGDLFPAIPKRRYGREAIPDPDMLLFILLLRTHNIIIEFSRNSPLTQSNRGKLLFFTEKLNFQYKIIWNLRRNWMILCSAWRRYCFLKFEIVPKGQKQW